MGCKPAWLTESLYADYSDLRGTPPQTITASEYVRQRRESLDHLKLQHLVSNYEVDFMNAESDSLESALQDDTVADYSEEEIRLMRIKFLSEYAN